jgi:hypothetical protein
MAEAGRRCPAFRTVGGSSLIRFGLDVSQKKRPFASSTMIAADYSVASAINRDSVAANEYSPVREERDDAPTLVQLRPIQREVREELLTQGELLTSIDATLVHMDHAQFAQLTAEARHGCFSAHD